MPTTLDGLLHPPVIACSTLDQTQLLEVVDRILQLCAPHLTHLPNAKSIADLADPDNGHAGQVGVVSHIRILEQPLTQQTRCFEFFQVQDIPYKDGHPDEHVIRTMLLTVQGQWVMWEREELRKRTHHSFTLLHRDWLGQLLAADTALVLGILKGLQGASSKGEKRALKRARAFAILDHDLTEMLERLGFTPPTT